VRAGLEAIEEVPGIGQAKAAAIFKAAVEWVEAHPVVVASEPTAEEGSAEPAGPDDAGSEDTSGARTG
jgi:hypothetical protein